MGANDGAAIDLWPTNWQAPGAAHQFVGLSARTSSTNGLSDRSLKSGMPGRLLANADPARASWPAAAVVGAAVCPGGRKLGVGLAAVACTRYSRAKLSSSALGSLVETIVSYQFHTSKYRHKSALFVEKVASGREVSAAGLRCRDARPARLAPGRRPCHQAMADLATRCPPMDYESCACVECAGHSSRRRAREKGGARMPQPKAASATIIIL